MGIHFTSLERGAREAILAFTRARAPEFFE
jgi:hypothetical protein